MTGVDEILAAKRREIRALEESGRLTTGRRIRPRFSFREALARPGLAVIAEVKRSSPSTGPFGVAPRPLRDAYIAAGADALSILSDAHFGMSAEEFSDLAAECRVPVLRKDFILAESQIEESDHLGADAILLIATFLSRDELDRLGARAESLGLDVLYEAHAPEDLAKIPARARIVGINNRDLSGGDYKTDIGLSAAMLSAVPPGLLRVAESGYDRPGQVPRGFDAVLMGGGLIRAFARGESVSDLVRSMKDAMLGA
jgi:indole-3-glycerol phosphate synthase